MDTILILLCIIAGTIGCIMLFYMDYAKEIPRPKSLLRLFLALLLVVNGFAIFGMKLQTHKLSSHKRYDIKTEIHLKTIDGKNVGADTVYIFIRK